MHMTCCVSHLQVDVPDQVFGLLMVHERYELQGYKQRRCIRMSNLQFMHGAIHVALLLLLQLLCMPLQDTASCAAC
jgi:hypothetical protein